VWEGWRRETPPYPDLTPRCWRQVAMGFIPSVATEAKEPFSGEITL
jgi:hypothetical protein